MKAILSGAALGVLLLFPPALSLAATAAQPAVLACVLGVLARPTLRRWTR
ncbi:hypothetical protein ACFW91_28625 [Streptomyces asoensis]